jgi:hypothetical protein
MFIQDKKWMENALNKMIENWIDKKEAKRILGILD